MRHIEPNTLDYQIMGPTSSAINDEFVADYSLLQHIHTDSNFISYIWSQMYHYS